MRTNMNALQAAALERVFAGMLRPAGLDPDGEGLYGANLHVDGGPDGLVWWYDDEPLSANGTLDGQGHGLVWLRRVGTVAGPTAV